MVDRRDFLRQSAALAALAATGSRLTAQASGLPAGRDRSAPLKVLILGGTGFIGPHLVRECVARGHAVTIFTRGRRDAALPPGIERLVGDRMINDTIPQGNLKALEGRRWDVVFDDSATDPRWVRQSATLLRDSGRYMFVSSTGVHLPYRSPKNDETAPLVLTPDNSPEYGVRKAQSERVVIDTFGDRGYVVRPGYIVGPGDTTDRFSYWPQRFAAGGEILVPGRRTDPSQFIDVRDLVTFMVKLVEEDRSGIYNFTGPAQRMGFGEFIDVAHRTLNPSATLTWVDDYAFLKANQMTYAIPWMIPEGDNEHHLQIDNRKALAAGLTFRPHAETLKDTLADWPNRLAALPAGQKPNFRWITPEKEVAMLAAWKGRR
jgi:2'-hydroxyisoflavone reductase